MTLPNEATVLRIYLGESDGHGSRPLFESIVLKAREMGLAGATVLRGPLGFGASSKLHSAKILRLSEDLPVIIEIVDVEAQIDRLLAEIDDLLNERGLLITKQAVTVVRHSHGPAPKAGGAS